MESSIGQVEVKTQQSKRMDTRQDINSAEMGDSVLRALEMYATTTIQSGEEDQNQLE